MSMTEDSDQALMDLYTGWERERGVKGGLSLALISVTMLKYHGRKQFGEERGLFQLTFHHCGEIRIVTSNSHITSIAKNREKLMHAHSLASAWPDFSIPTQS